jgi:hypothetical protein
MAGSDFVHLETDLAEPVMRGLTAVGDELDGAWQSCRAEIDAGEAGIGGDMLGQAFRGVYGGAAEQLRAGAGRMPGSLSESGGVGLACCADYLEADRRAAAAMPAAAGGR